jgi:hypothetical protein
LPAAARAGPPRALAAARREAGMSEGEFFVLRVGETRLLSN